MRNAILIESETMGCDAWALGTGHWAAVEGMMMMLIQPACRVVLCIIARVKGSATLIARGRGLWKLSQDAPARGDSGLAGSREH